MIALGKLELTGVTPEELPDFAVQMNLEILPITIALDIDALSSYN